MFFTPSRRSPSSARSSSAQKPFSWKYTPPRTAPSGRAEQSPGRGTKPTAQALAASASAALAASFCIFRHDCFRGMYVPKTKSHMGDVMP